MKIKELESLYNSLCALSTQENDLASLWFSRGAHPGSQQHENSISSSLPALEKICGNFVEFFCHQRWVDSYDL